MLGRAAEMIAPRGISISSRNSASSSRRHANVAEGGINNFKLICATALARDVE